MKTAALTLSTLLALGLVVGACSPAEDADDANRRRIPSGLDGVADIQVEVLAAGKGVQPGPGDTVGMHYVGTFLDGKEFDSSRKTGRLFSFPLGRGQVIKGWDVIVAQMKVGDHWKCTIPYQLAYGERGHPGGIPGRADLVFDMELVEVKSGER